MLTDPVALLLVQWVQEQYQAILRSNINGFAREQDNEGRLKEGHTRSMYLYQNHPSRCIAEEH